MTRVFLTGGSGFVGRQVLKALREAGHEVTVTGRPGSFERAGIDLAGATQLTTANLFIEREDWWVRALEGHDMVIHAAWFVDPASYIHSRHNLICAAGSVVMARAAARAGVRHITGLGTCMEYKLPSASLKPDAPLGPSNLYSASKLATYFMIDRRCREEGLDFTWCRLFYLHGEAEKPGRLASYIHAQLSQGEYARLSAGTQLRDYLDVSDAGRMVAAVADTKQTGVVNICSGRPTTIRLFAERIADGYRRRDLLLFSHKPVPSTDPAAVVGFCNWQAPA